MKPDSARAVAKNGIARRKDALSVEREQKKKGEHSVIIEDPVEVHQTNDDVPNWKKKDVTPVYVFVDKNRGQEN